MCRFGVRGILCASDWFSRAYLVLGWMVVCDEVLCACLFFVWGFVVALTSDSDITSHFALAHRRKKRQIFGTAIGVRAVKSTAQGHPGRPPRRHTGRENAPRRRAPYSQHSRALACAPATEHRHSDEVLERGVDLEQCLGTRDLTDERLEVL